MQKIVILGNSGSGKSTLAKNYVQKYGLPHLDLDSLAWQNTQPPKRKPLPQSAKRIDAFLLINDSWVIEGCYTDLLEMVTNAATEMVFLNPGVETCVSNCKSRPWEPHKYKTAAAQDKNLPMLLDWVRGYIKRDDEFSLQSHVGLYAQFNGDKVEYKSNERDARLT